MPQKKSSHDYQQSCISRVCSHQPLKHETGTTCWLSFVLVQLAMPFEDVFPSHTFLRLLLRGKVCVKTIVILP